MQYTPPRGPVQVRCREQAQKSSDLDIGARLALVVVENETGLYLALPLVRLALDWRERFALLGLALLLRAATDERRAP
jgi:hypothetical protein